MDFNRSEEMASGLAASAVVGRNFFTEIAPCTNVRAFLAPFRRALAKRELNVRFDYLFTQPDRIRRVTIHLFTNESSRGIWVFVGRPEAG